jgi:hypothetical protein
VIVVRVDGEDQVVSRGGGDVADPVERVCPVVAIGTQSDVGRGRDADFQGLDDGPTGPTSGRVGIRARAVDATALVGVLQDAGDAGAEAEHG